MSLIGFFKIMTIKISYIKKKVYKNSNNLVLFTNEDFKIGSIKKYLSQSEFDYINDLLKVSDLKKKLLVFEINSKKKIVLISIKKNLKFSDVENLGAEFYASINYGKNLEYFVIPESIDSKLSNFVGYFLHGLRLKSYEFEKYKTKKKKRVISLNVIQSKKSSSFSDQQRFKALEEGTFFARDLVSDLVIFYILTRKKDYLH